jgi:hypothetical protein
LSSEKIKKYIQRIDRIFIYNSVDIIGYNYI